MSSPSLSRNLQIAISTLFYKTWSSRGPVRCRYCRQSRIESARGTDTKLLFQFFSFFYFHSLRSSIIVIIIISFPLRFPSSVSLFNRRVHTLKPTTVNGRELVRLPPASSTGWWTANVLPPSIVSRSRQVVCLRTRCRSAYTRARARALASDRRRF